MSRLEMQPKTMFVRTTENCNAGCFMCGYAHKHGEPFLEDSHVKKIVYEAQQAGIKLIRFTGGETLLHREMSNYIAYIKQHDIKTSLITNGYLLPRRAASLVEAGLDQVIVSIDASHPKLHNSLRKLNNLFENAIEGIQTIKSLTDQTIVRINTVVSPQNISDLKEMIPLLTQLGVDQWSVIPLKAKDNLWQYTNIEKVLNYYLEFANLVKDTHNPQLLGYSAQWAGRTPDEARNYFMTGIPFTPEGKCNLVDLVRFYIPHTDKLLACNCVPWRLENVNFQTDIGLSGLNDGTLSPLVDYLHESGPSICKGCEPNNAYLGEHPEILEDDIFAF